MKRDLDKHCQIYEHKKTLKRQAANRRAWCYYHNKRTLGPLKTPLSFESEERLETLFDKDLLAKYKELEGEDLIPQSGPC